MSSVVGEGSRTLNHGGEWKEQQVLVGPHPCPSHRGLSVYMMIDPLNDATPDSQK